MFNLIGLGEHAGSGVPDIYKAWRDVGLEEPVVEEQFGGGTPDRTVLTLPLTSVGAASVNIGISVSTDYVVIGINGEQLKALLEFCRIPKSKGEIMDFLQTTSRSTFERKVLKPLLKAEQLFRTDPNNLKNPKQKYYSRNKE